ncbi:uncharacterized protein LOC110863430 [Folsomia candida]|uniref:Kelch-like protein 25 n=1 Tax=Folsomia candida TaxID=158441 RepID=A0A226EZC7_FOLCA|nr:uncharacterized protein LOC110863430 [Folsomia candida]OXA62922.1 Kelch-like protein 25 [Folsomia candida]
MSSSYLFTILLATTLVLANFPFVVHPQTLEAVLTSSKFPYGLTFTGIAYDGDDSIYIFGGLYQEYNSTTTEISDQIYRYSVMSDTLTPVGQLPNPIYGGTVEHDGKGNYFFFGGHLIHANYSLKIFKFTPSDGQVVQVGTILRYLFNSPSIRYNNTVVILGSSYYSDPAVFSFDMETYQVKWLRDMPKSYVDHTAVWDEAGNRAVVFGHVSQSWTPNPVEPFTLYKPTGFGDNEVVDVILPFSFTGLTQATVVVGRAAYVIGAQRPSTSNYIARVDLETIEVEQIYVENFAPYYDLSDVDIFDGISAVYVEKLSRIYYFGGSLQFYSLHDLQFIGNVAYIDLTPLGQN